MPENDPQMTDGSKPSARLAASRNVVVYSPEAMIRSPRRMMNDMVTDLVASRGLAWRLAVRDVRAQYRGSLLGFVWAFITPLVSTAMWIFLSAAGVVKVAETGIPYPAYVFSGTMLWQMFTEALASPLAQINAAKAMLAKLNFPREALIISGFYKVCFNAGSKLLILIPAVLLFGVIPDWHLALLPMAALVLVLVGLVIGLLIAPLGILFSDVGRIIPIFTQFLMYLSPVVFAMPTEGAMARVFSLNFMTPLILTGRAWLTGEDSPMLLFFLAVAACACLTLLVGWVLYKITMPVLVERMSS